MVSCNDDKLRAEEGDVEQFSDLCYQLIEFKTYHFICHILDNWEKCVEKVGVVFAQQHNFKHKITAIFLHHSTTDNYYMSSRRIES